MSAIASPSRPSVGDPDAKLHRLLLDSAERDPDAPAYGPMCDPLRYGPLASRAARLAATLRELGVGRGTRVAVALDGRVEYLVSYYGVLMAGATVVPLGTDTRAGILGRTLNHCEAAVLIGAGSVVARLAEADPLPARLRAVLSVGAPGGALPGAVEWIDFATAEREGAELFDAGAQGPELASISYTSGTSGVPKGVMLSHRSLVANARSIIEYLGLGSGDRLAMVLPYHYVYGNSVLHTHLAVGGSVVHAGSTAFPVRVLEAIRDERCTGLSGVPSTFAALLRVGDPGRFDLGCLRYVTQAGGAMSPALTERVRAAFPRVRLFVMYGQTEAGARLSYLPPEELDRKPGSVGIPIAGVSLSVVDPAGRPVPRGIVGEIIATGANVMAGYLGDPEATERVLRGGALHTGDMGYFDRDGYLYISGRCGDMISSGGHRIGPQEVEAVVSALPGVEDCAVVGVEDEMLGQRLVAVVVPKDSNHPDPRSLQRACLARLPRYKVPSEVRFVRDLPYSDRGKLLRSVVRAGLEDEAAGGTCSVTNACRPSAQHPPPSSPGIARSD